MKITAKGYAVVALTLVILLALCRIVKAAYDYEVWSLEHSIPGIEYTPPKPPVAQSPAKPPARKVYPHNPSPEQDGNGVCDDTCRKRQIIFI